MLSFSYAQILWNEIFLLKEGVELYNQTYFIEFLETVKGRIARIYSSGWPLYF